MKGELGKEKLGIGIGPRRGIFQGSVFAVSTLPLLQPQEHLAGCTGRVAPEGRRRRVTAVPLDLPNASILALMLKFRFNFQNLICSLSSALNNISCLRIDGCWGTMDECSDG
jgi:hypothetical protein